jgi:hypothetical protein
VTADFSIGSPIRTFNRTTSVTTLCNTAQAQSKSYSFLFAMVCFTVAVCF